MKDKELRDHIYSIKSGQAWAALQKLKENGLDLKTPNDLVQHFIDNLDDLLEVANDSIVKLDDNEMKSSMLSSQPLEKVGYISVFKMNEEMKHA